MTWYTYTVHDGPSGSGGTPWPGDRISLGARSVADALARASRVTLATARELVPAGLYRPGDQITIRVRAEDGRGPVLASVTVTV